MNLRELSSLLGLSQTTVSRALNGYPEVSEATRQRVKEAAKLHGYRPNRWAKGLATGRSRNIAHVIPMSSTHEMVNPVFADFIAGASEVYNSAGYEMILSIVKAEDGPRVYRELGARHRVGGLMVHAPLRGDSRIELLNEIGTPFVVHGRASVDDTQYSWLDMNNRRAFERATTFLIDLGHRDIALVNGQVVMDFAARRLDGYDAALAAAHLPIRPELICGGEMTEQFGYESAMRLLSLPRPPTAFLVSSLISAIGTRRACEDLGLKLGHDISIVTHDDDLSYFSNLGTEPYFTSLRSPVRDHGRQAAEMLLTIIEDPTKGPIHRLVEAELHVGRSTGRPPASPAQPDGVSAP